MNPEDVRGVPKNFCHPRSAANDVACKSLPIKAPMFGDSAALVGSVAGKPPLLGLFATPHPNSEPRHPRTNNHAFVFWPSGRQRFGCGARAKRDRII